MKTASMIASRKMRSPLKWHGGKSYLARRIISLMPPHRTYVEPYFGGGSILLNKVPVEREVAGDIDHDLIHFWWTLREHPDQFSRFLLRIPYCEESWSEWGLSEHFHTDGVDRAARILVRNRFSRGGLGKDFAWSERLRGGQPGDVNAWDTIRQELPAIANRIKGVELHCRKALDLIELHDFPDTLIYCDPPYLHEARTHRTAYAHEMTYGDHVKLLSLLVTSKATVLVSGYRSPLYDAALWTWKRHDFDLPNHSGQGQSKQRRTECVWINRSS